MHSYNFASFMLLWTGQTYWGNNTGWGYCSRECWARYAGL